MDLCKKERQRGFGSLSFYISGTVLRNISEDDFEVD